jgi:hypothetical protein
MSANPPQERARRTVRLGPRSGETKLARVATQTILIVVRSHDLKFSLEEDWCARITGMQRRVNSLTIRLAVRSATRPAWALQSVY